MKICHVEKIVYLYTEDKEKEALKKAKELGYALQKPLFYN